MRSRILYLARRPEDARKLSEMLHPLPILLDHVETLQQARDQLQEQDYDVVLTEAQFSDGNWLDVLHLVRDSPQEAQIIVTDRQPDARFWPEALNLGAHGLLAQPFDPLEVQRILFNACGHFAARAAAAV